MEKFKQKLSSLRSEAETANDTSEKLLLKIKLLEDETIHKGHDITSARVKIKVLEEKLEKAERDSEIMSQKSSDSLLREEQAETNLKSLETHLEESEKRHEELKIMNQTIKEEMEDFIRLLDVA